MNIYWRKYFRKGAENVLLLLWEIHTHMWYNIVFALAIIVFNLGPWVMKSKFSGGGESSMKVTLARDWRLKMDVGGY